MRLGYQVDDQEAIVHLVTTWEANRAARVAAWNAQREADARAAEETELVHRAQEEEEERLARKEAK